MAANSSSKEASSWPWTRRPLRSTAVTAAVSSSPTWTRTALTRGLACSVMVTRLAQVALGLREQRASDGAAPLTVLLVEEASAGRPDPADSAGRRTRHQREGGHVVHHDGTCGHHRPAPDLDRGDAHRARAHGAALPESDPDGLPVGGVDARTIGTYGAGVLVVGEYDGRPDEDAVLHDSRLVDLGEVLHLHPVAEPYAGTDVRPAADHALGAQDGTLPDLGQTPDHGALPDLRVGGDLGGGVKLRHVRVPSSSCPARRHPSTSARHSRRRRRS